MLPCLYALSRHKKAKFKQMRQGAQCSGVTFYNSAEIIPTYIYNIPKCATFISSDETQESKVQAIAGRELNAVESPPLPSVVAHYPKHHSGAFFVLLGICTTINKPLVLDCGHYVQHKNTIRDGVTPCFLPLLHCFYCLYCLHCFDSSHCLRFQHCLHSLHCSHCLHCLHC